MKRLELTTLVLVTLIATPALLAEPAFKSVDELGPVISQGGHLYYAKTGERARFVGSGFCTDVPDDRSLDEKTALLMARYGHNLIRFHMHGLYYAYNDQDTSLTFNAKWLDDIDRIVAASRKYGIYFSLSGLEVPKKEDGDQFPGPFFPGDSVEEWKEASQNRGDPRYLAISRKILENFLNHVNPYTKLAYKDDPAFLYHQIWNESNFGYDLTVNRACLPDNAYNRKWVNHFWHEFLEGKYGSAEAALEAWKLPADSPVTLWAGSWRNDAELADAIEFGEWYDIKVYTDYKRMIDGLCGRDVPVMLTQLQTYPSNLYLQTKTNLGGFHAYFGFDGFLAKVDTVPLLMDEVLLFGVNGLEWETDRTWWGQNDNRIISLATTAAVAAIQDIDGIAFYGNHWGWFADVARDPDPTRVTFEISGVNAYAIFSDPVHRPMLKLASNLLVRPDLMPASKRLIVRHTPQRLRRLDNVCTTGQNAYPPDWVYYDQRPMLESKMLDYCISNRFVDEQPPIVENGPDLTLEPRQFWADFRATGTLPGNHPKGWQFRIDTLRTQGFWGWNRTPGQTMTIETSDFDFRTAEEVFTAVATSESEVPLSDADDILLVAVSKARYFPERTSTGWWAFNPETTQLFYPTIEVSIKRPCSGWTLQPLDDAFEPLGPARSGDEKTLTLDQKVHFYRLTLTK